MVFVSPSCANVDPDEDEFIDELDVGRDAIIFFDETLLKTSISQDTSSKASGTMLTQIFK